MQGKDWTGTTFGNEWMHKWLIRCLRFIDVRLLYAFASVFIVPICIIVRPGGHIIYHYFRRRQYSRPSALWKTYINHCLFAQTVIDKFAMYAGKQFRIEIEGYEKFLSLESKEDSFMLLSSHIGNYEIAGYTLVSDNKPLNALVFADEKVSVMQNRESMFQKTNIKLIPIRQDMSHLFEINRALQDGETISIPADRISGSNKTIEKQFLGAPAGFPFGPFNIAVLKGLDVLAVNVMKASMGTYKIHVTPLYYDKTESKKKQIDELSDRYVKELERLLHLYPEQWYNYFDFWKDGNKH